MEFASVLLKWFRENGRDLPWRQTRDPYAIWLSEIILQQTQVKQGWDYWERFMHRWPTVEALAAATEDEVLREWQGLGYYSRARNLHFAAKQIVALGHLPSGASPSVCLLLSSMAMSTVSSPVTLASIPPLIPPKAKNSSNPSLSPSCLLTFLIPQPITRPSWTSAPSSVRPSHLVARSVC